MGKDIPYIPLGLSVALAENTKALRYFSELSAENQRRVIFEAGNLRSKSEIDCYIKNLICDNKAL